MTVLLVGMQESLLVVRSTPSDWQTLEKLRGKSPQCVAFDQIHHDICYCGTFGDGLWKSTDSGDTWKPVGKGVSHKEVMSVSVSQNERVNENGVVYTGTEPSSLFRSEDGGKTWLEQKSLRALRSSSEWSFPPRPHTSHVRWIALDPFSPGQIYLCIEAGALVRSSDGGKTWTDRVASGPFDTHVLMAHARARGRLYSSAGDGYFESFDCGKSWKRLMTGLKHRYLYGLAVDPEDPELVVVSAASGPYEAHNPKAADSFVYSKKKGEEWKLSQKGLGEPAGTIISMLASDPKKHGGFFAANNKGVYSSADGVLWERVELEWPKAYLAQHPWGIAVRNGS